MSGDAVVVEGLSKSYAAPGRAFRALDDIRFRVARGEMVALIGASGSGKSTLLRHLSGLIRGDAGSAPIRVCGHDIQTDGRLHERIGTARADIGFVFQQFNLVDRLPVLTNVLAGTLARVPVWRSVVRGFTAAEKRLGLDALARVGIEEHAYKRASQLSGGQQQRAAIARTLVQRARVLLADEPIASLDPESARRVMQILADINRQDGATVLVSLHQVDIAMRFCPRTIALRRGRIVFDGPSCELKPAMLRELYGMEADELLTTSSHTQDAMAAAGSAYAPAVPAALPPFLPTASTFSGAAALVEHRGTVLAS